MKKLLFVCLAFSASLLFSNNTSAQTKIGYLDDQFVLALMPGIDKISPLLESFQKDSLQVEYDYTLSNFQRLDSAFKKDSAGMAPKAREMAVSDMNRLKQKLVYWSQYSQQLYEAKQEQLLQPFRAKIFEALTLVLAEQKYTLVLKTDALSPYQVWPILDNLGIRVALKLKLTLPKDYDDAWKAATGGSSAAPAGKPPVSKPKG